MNVLILALALGMYSHEEGLVFERTPLRTTGRVVLKAVAAPLRLTARVIANGHNRRVERRQNRRGH